MANRCFLLALWVFISVLVKQALSEGEAVAFERQGSGRLVYEGSSGDPTVTLSNKLIDLEIVNHGAGAGSIKSLVYKREGKPNVELLETRQKDNVRGYWDMHRIPLRLALHRSFKSINKKLKFGESEGPSWSTADNGDKILGLTFNPATRANQPVNSKLHYSMRSDLAGTYCTLLLNHSRAHPAGLLSELRLVLKLNSDLFDYSFVTDDRQRFMPTNRDISKHHSSVLDFKEARLIYDARNKSFENQVDHKYHFSVETKDALVYGWISSKLNVGVWIISPNKWEYLGGGPQKQDLSVQTGPNLLAMLQSCHYGTPAINLTDGEEWKKVFGPFLVYVNEAEDIKGLIADAKARAVRESLLWPYKSVPFTEYPKREERGTVTGRVVKRDSFAGFNIETSTVSGIWMGLTDEQSPISNWEDEVKSYQFWNTTNDDGEFTIYNVRPGTYILHSLVHGFLVDSTVLQTVTVKENWVSTVGEIVLRPAQKGPIVWEIGYPDRSAAEFMVPAELSEGNWSTDVSTKDAFRQYGLWQTFTDLYPERDPVYTVGESQWSKDWFFAHVARPGNVATDREIAFTVDQVIEGDYTLRLAIAGAHQAALEVRLNNNTGSSLHDTGPFGGDNALARAGIHGHYLEFSISLSHMNLRSGQNSLFLRQRKTENRFSYVMYDYLRLEAPAHSLGIRTW